VGGLADHLRRRIAAAGPLTVAEFMAAALGHPRHGYYMRRDPLGVAGDFITAPEISQIFGELIGLWCAVVWQEMGAPDPVVVVELGPGRGTLMADMLRAAATAPGFLGAARLHMVETSPVLRARQKEALAAALLGSGRAWHDTFDGVPEGPMLLIANEFFDALPVRQFQRTGEGWRERRVGADEDGGFRFVLGPPAPLDPLAMKRLADAPSPGVIEVCSAGLVLAGAIGKRVARHGGGALIIDYGPADGAAGETLQAVKGHAYHPVLETPGEADLTAHVDFAGLAAAATEAGARAHGPVSQGAFLESLGIGARADALLVGATAQQTSDIRSARRRLVDENEMGTLFKALVVAHPEMATPPGFA
jgi:NADH dehydrogenase [ubiquinone] 1 alpha subcomplex assembly factor 7